MRRLESVCSGFALLIVVKGPLLHATFCSLILALRRTTRNGFVFLMVVVATIAKGQSRSVPFLIKMYEFETDLSARGVNNCSDWLEF